MNILLTNDDGYNSKGIHALARRLSREHNVVIIAPENERSGASHAVSFFSGITYAAVENEDGIESYAISGSPADCVLFGVKYLLADRQIDVVVSGINTVLNLGSDIMYSGTFGAAQEATYHRIKGIAVSLDARKCDDYDFSADFIARNLDNLCKYAVEDVTVNVNIPCNFKQDIKGVKVTQTTFRPYEEKYRVCTAHDGREVFVVSGHPLPQPPERADGDCAQSEIGYITVSPIKMIGNIPELIAELKDTEFQL